MRTGREGIRTEPQQAFVVPALRKQREERGTHWIGGASEIKSRGTGLYFSHDQSLCFSHRATAFKPASTRSPERASSHHSSSDS